MITGLHHVALIVSNYEVSRAFYVDTLGLEIIAEVYRAERQSWKLDLAVPGGGQLELFSFPDPPARLSQPEACGLRHLALRVSDIAGMIERLEASGVACEPRRVDEFTGAAFTFFKDPDGLPIELYEA